MGSGPVRNLVFLPENVKARQSYIRIVGAFAVRLPEMKVFISWSGKLSGQVAELLSGWIGDVLQGVETWISSEDIDKGSLWFGDISAQLGGTGIGILCLTGENIGAPWILFEAGALSKGLTRNRVCPLLIDLEHTDLKPPLSQFNATLPNRNDMFKLLKTINAERGDARISDERLQKAFERWWDDFANAFPKILKDYKPSKEPERRSVDDMTTEILELTRSIQKTMQEEGRPVGERTSGFGHSLLRMLKEEDEPKSTLAEILSNAPTVPQPEPRRKHLGS